MIVCPVTLNLSMFYNNFFFFFFLHLFLIFQNFELNLIQIQGKVEQGLASSLVKLVMEWEILYWKMGAYSELEVSSIIDGSLKHSIGLYLKTYS